MRYLVETSLWIICGRIHLWCEAGLSIVSMNDFYDTFICAEWVKPVRHKKVSPPISIYGGPTRLARACTPPDEYASRKTFKAVVVIYDVRLKPTTSVVVVGLGAHENSWLSPAHFRTFVREKLSVTEECIARRSRASGIIWSPDNVLEVSISARKKLLIRQINKLFAN